MIWRFTVPQTREIQKKKKALVLKNHSPGKSDFKNRDSFEPQYFGHMIEELTHWKRPWFWERLRAGGGGDGRGWDGWMASPTQWTRVWVKSRRWWRTGKCGMLQSTGSQRVGHDWGTEQQPTYKSAGIFIFYQITSFPKGRNQIWRYREVYTEVSTTAEVR